VIDAPLSGALTGKEVLLLADTHYSFYRKHKEAQGASPEEIDSLRFRECYMFGTSTANIKIESTRMRMIRSQTRPWLVSSLRRKRLYCFPLTIFTLT
jgi:hypothetical protein